MKTSKELSASEGGRKKTHLDIAVPLLFAPGSDTSPSHIEGFAIHPGLFNGIVEVPEEELQNIQLTLKGKQLRNNHKTGPLDVIGRVNETSKTFDSDAGKHAVTYEAEIDQDDDTALKIQNKIQKGYINASSIGFEHDSECSKCGEDFMECEHWFGEAHVIARNCEAFEISIVSMGADGDATATVSGLSKKFVNEFKKQFEFKKEAQLHKIEGGKVMEPKKNEGAVTGTLEVGKLVQQLAETQADALDKDKQLSKLQAQMEEQKKALDLLTKESKDKKDAEDEKLLAAQKKSDELEKELNKVKGATNKQIVSELVARQIEVGLVKKEDKDSEIESLLGKSEETIEMLVANVEILEDKAKKEAEALKKEKGNPKIPEFNALTKDGKTNELDVEDENVVQYLVHTVFGYDKVFGDENSKGEKYMGGKV